MSNNVIVVCGGGGFIGGHLAETLISDPSNTVRCVDIKPIGEWYQVHENVENLVLDLKSLEDCRQAVADGAVVYNLAADMGGMGFIENNKALCMLSVLINTHLLMASEEAKVGEFFYASSACVYAADKQGDPDITALKEADAYPAQPEDGYGWEKLFSERMTRHFVEDFGITARVARFHNVYGPWGTYDGGREKAPAAICRKVIQAKIDNDHSIEIWGDGHQTRSFMYIDDCIRGIGKLMSNEILVPINLGSAEKVSINQLVDVVEEIAGVELKRNYKLDAPKGVNGRNSDNTLIREHLDWEPDTTLKVGMERTYRWIHDQMTNNKPANAFV